MSRQTQAIIHADALQHNFRLLKALAPNSQSMAVIKANAYGHGAINVARILRADSARFAVAILEEATSLREEGITAPVVILQGAHQPSDCVRAGKLECILVTHNITQLEWVKSIAPGQRPVLWLKVDTGMHRLGFSCEEVPKILKDYREVLGDAPTLVTHLACADDTENPFTQEQVARFARLQQQTGLPASIANSPGTLAWPQTHADWNRLGIALYGAEPLAASKPLGLRPAMSLLASVIAVRHISSGETVGYSRTWQAVRPSTIATIGIGYADGYPRHCPNGTPVWINGQRAPLIGRVSMDMITVDVTDVGPVLMGDKVELWGENIAVNEIAHCAGTIAYDLLSGLSARVPRVVRYR